MEESGIYCPRCGTMTIMTKPSHAYCPKPDCHVHIRTYGVIPHGYSMEIREFVDSQSSASKANEDG